MMKGIYALTKNGGMRATGHAVLLMAFAGGIESFSDDVTFNRDIRPILSDKCFHCHGPDEKERKGGLRLDVRADALKGGQSGKPALVPGKPESSHLLSRIQSDREDQVMPPKSLHKPVSRDEIALLQRWISRGAEYEGHWAFIPPKRTEGSIDGFIRASLAKKGLKPSQEADRATLIRRVSLDLTGVPPTPEEIAAFESDSSTNAYARLVDRLMASPRYGEHMAAQWLDLARYADSNGFQSDTQRRMWHWRDWVIGALNRNLRFDQFTIEQLAGDLLPGATRDQIVATGFNRNHRLNGEGGRIVEEWFAETVIDRVEATGLTWMALTLNCCRCHDHKYDPITQKEFYQLYAFFNSNEESGVLDEFGGGGSSRKGGNSKPVLMLPTPEEEARQVTLREQQKQAEAAVETARANLPALQAAWENEVATDTGEGPNWQSLDSAHARSEGGATLTRQSDGSWLASGLNPSNDVYVVEAPVARGQIAALRLDVIPDASLPNQSLGRGFNGNFVFSAFEAGILKPGADKPMPITFARAEADYEQANWTIDQVVSRKEGGGWAVDGNDPGKRVARSAVFVCDPVQVPDGAKLLVRMRHGSPFPDHNIGRFRLSATARFVSHPVPANVLAAVRIAPAQRTPAQKESISTYFANQAGNPVKKASDAVAAAKKELAELEAGFENTMVFKERDQPKQAHVLLRGEYDKIGDPVARAVPAVLPPLPAGAPTNRLGFAQWLVSGMHPLTARVWVNRAWERFFGAGLVRSTENFGSQADWPTHPELLDWLATEFVRLGWDMKALHRLIVMSDTYRQSSVITPESLAKDEDNRWLSRAPRIRLSAETLRDQALAVSGLLVEKLGGPSVKPYMPEAVWDETSVYGDMRNYKADTGEGLYRRTLYTIWKRTAAPPTMMLFDSPSREICTVRRSRSNTPTQALSLLNEVTYVESARVLAEQMLRQGGAKPEDRITWAFRRVTARAPESTELKTLSTNLRARLDTFAREPESARQLIAQGSSKADPALNPAELAAYTVTANVLLNLDEVVTRN